MTVNRQDSRKASAGQTCWIACDKPVSPGSHIFKTGSQTADMQSRIDKLPLPGITVDLDIKLTATGICINLPATDKIWQIDIETQPARKHDLEAATLQKEFSRTGSDIFTIGNISAATAPGLFMPASQLKELRRKFWEWCHENVSAASLQTAYAARLAPLAIDLSKKHTNAGKAQENQGFTLTVLTKASKPAPIAGAITAHSIYTIGSNTEEAVLPEFCPETELPRLTKQIKKALNSDIKRFRATSLYALELLETEIKNQKREDITITASYPLPLCNSAAFKTLQQYGVTRAAAWVELGQESINELISKIGTAAEIITYARLPMLTTRMEIPALGEIKDARGALFYIERSHSLTVLLPEKVFSINPETPAGRFIDLTHAELGESAVSEFNFPRELV
jgi:putative protease